jgi:peptidoglycan/xylan/chitin deacetylase (PgdA/CDA1 family)
MRNREPLVSFTFDDVPASAYENGATVLEDCGIRGTFYIAAGTCGVKDTYWNVLDRDQVTALHGRGHEIGCHTYSHANVETLDADGMDDECLRNYELLHQLCPAVRVRNFCYPYGGLSLPRKLQLQKRFDTCRGVYEGINAGKIDLGLLRVIELYDRTLTEEKLHRVLREIRDRNGWLIFYTHDVATQPSWIGCSLALLRSTVAAVQSLGVPCVPVRDALSLIGYSAG